MKVWVVVQQYYDSIDGVEVFANETDARRYALTTNNEPWEVEVNAALPFNVAEFWYLRYVKTWHDPRPSINLHGYWVLEKYAYAHIDRKDEETVTGSPQTADITLHGRSRAEVIEKLKAVVAKHNLPMREDLES